MYFRPIFLTKGNKTEDPSVQYAGEGYLTQGKVWHNYHKDKRILENTKEPENT